MNPLGVRRCEKCGGVFADNEASRRIVNAFDRLLFEVGFVASQGKPRTRETGAALTCPECLVAMRKVRIEGAVARSTRARRTGAGSIRASWRR